jgi:hypothetical protein
MKKTWSTIKVTEWNLLEGNDKNYDYITITTENHVKTLSAGMEET